MQKTNMAPAGASSTGSSGNKMQAWGKVVGDLKQSGKILLYTNLLNTNAIELNDMTIGIEYPNGLTPFARSDLEKPESINELTRLISMEYGKEMRVKIAPNMQSEARQKEVNPIENMANNLDIPFNIIDE